MTRQPKIDTKESKVIAQVIRNGRYHESILPEYVYAELCESMKLYDMIKEYQSSIKTQTDWIATFQSF